MKIGSVSLSSPFVIAPKKPECKERLYYHLLRLNRDINQVFSQAELRAQLEADGVPADRIQRLLRARDFLSKLLTQIHV